MTGVALRLQRCAEWLRPQPYNRPSRLRAVTGADRTRAPNGRTMADCANHVAIRLVEPQQRQAVAVNDGLHRAVGDPRRTPAGMGVVHRAE